MIRSWRKSSLTTLQGLSEEKRIEKLFDTIWNVENLNNMSDLTKLMVLSVQIISFSNLKNEVGY